MYPCCWQIECSELQNLSGSSFPRESFPFPRSNFPFSRSGLSDLATLGQTTVRSRKRKIRSRKWKALSRKRNFAFKFFQLWAVSFQQHGTYILFVLIRSLWNSFNFENIRLEMDFFFIQCQIGFFWEDSNSKIPFYSFQKWISYLWPFYSVKCVFFKRVWHKLNVLPHLSPFRSDFD